jgi:hypothetical protein
VHRPGERLKAVTRRRHILRVAEERLVAGGSYAICIAFALSLGIHKLSKSDTASRSITGSQAAKDRVEIPEAVQTGDA